jgi:Abortive infection C-terminus
MLFMQRKIIIFLKMIMTELEHLKNDYEHAEFFQDTLIGCATNDDCGGTADDYINLRKYFSDNPITKDLLPEWIKFSRNTGQFWEFIKKEFSTYAERRTFIYKEMNPLLDHCETKQTLPSESSINEALQRFDEIGINFAWRKALDRKVSDPEGAITISRSILESVCKHILDAEGINYESKIDLSDLYKKTAKKLNLHPEQHIESIFKQILGGCSGIVNGLGTLRNKLGDAHGKGEKQVKPKTRHAELAVNLSGSMALFLIDTYNAIKN